MELSYLKFIENANEAFSAFKNSYIALNKADETGDKSLFTELRSDWYTNNGDLRSPLQHFIYSLLDYEEIDGLSDDVAKCLLNNHIGVIEYTKVFFLKQYTLVTKEEVDYYLNNQEDCNDLFEELYDGENDLSNADLLKALKIQFIQCLLEFEYEFKKAYPFFEPRFLNSAYEKLHSKINNGIGYNIRLDYPEDQILTIIAETHKALYGPYIDVELNEFTKHFKPFAAKMKMRWLGSQTQLVLLFRGKRIPNTRRRAGINFENHSTLQILCDHFCQPDNTDWDRNKLKKTQDKIDDPYQIHEDDADMKRLFFKIGKLTT